MTKIWIVERLLGAPYVAFTRPTGEQDRALITTRRIGPFGDRVAAADYLSKNAARHASYSMEYEETPP